MQVILGHYPMTIAQLNTWAKHASTFTPKEIGRVLDMLDRTVILRPEPKEWR